MGRSRAEPLDEQQPARRVPTGGERSLNGPRARPRKVGKETPELGKDPAVVARVGDEQHEFIGWIISTLERNPPLECLGVVEAHLKLDRRSPTRAADQGVPSSAFRPIGQCRQRNFKLPGQRSCDGAQECREPSVMCLVPDGHSPGEHPDCGIQPEHSRDAGELNDLQRGRLASLDLRQPRPRHVTRRGHMLLADTEVQTCLNKLLTQVAEESLSKPSSAIERPLS